jgi:hypothetical protein
MNEKCRDAGYMRQLHNAAASHAIFVAANQRLRRAIMDEKSGMPSICASCITLQPACYFHGSQLAPAARHYE